MQDNEKKPALRFKGFTDPWEQRKLAELTKTITTGKSVNSDEGEVSDGDIGVLKTSCVSYDRFNSSESKPVVKSEQQLVKCAVEKDSVIVSRMNTPERVGACGYVSTDFPNLFLPDRLWKLKFQDTVDTYFVYMMLVSSAYKEKITSMASGTSGSMYNIPKETFLNLQLVIPAKIDEQKQLGKILKKIDTLITLHQRKYEKLVNIKKSMLDKMFPKNGASVPEIRFKGFTDLWEQRKLTNLCEKFTDGDWIEAKDQSDSGVRLVQTGNVGVTEYLDKPNNKKWISFETFEQLHCEEVYPGDILISRLPEPAGRACIMPNLGTKMITAVDCTIVRPNAVTSTRFLLQYLSSQAYFDAVNTCLAGGTRQRISRGNLAQFNVPIPSSKIEQEKIGEVLEKLDTLITLHQRKLEKLQNIKKSCLEKMFV